MSGSVGCKGLVSSKAGVVLELLSVIVPVYNAEQYLDKCINSILCQSYGNLEIILIDDGSTDRSGAICKELCQKDPRVKYVYKENEGACFARRDGLFLAVGSYVTFVDSDDYLEPDIYEKILGWMLEQKADIATFAYQMSDTHAVSCDLAKPGIYTGKSKDELCATMIYDEKAYRCGILCSLCTKIYHKDLLIKAMDRIQPGLSLWEDLTYLYLPFVWADTVLITDIPGYVYSQHDNSVTHKKDEEELEKTVYSFEVAKENYAKCEGAVQDSLILMYARAIRDIMWRTCENAAAHRCSIDEAIAKLDVISENQKATVAIKEALERQTCMPVRDKKMLGLLIQGKGKNICEYYRRITFPKRAKKYVGRHVRKMLGWK